LSSVIKVDKIQSDTGTVNVASKIEFPAGTVSAPSIFPTGDTNTGIFFPAADTIAFAEGGVEAMRISNTSNVGIGTTSPDLKLTVAGGFNLRNSVRAGALEIDSSGNFWVGTATTAGNIYLETGHTTSDLPSTGTARVTVNQYGLGLGATPSSGTGITFPATQSASSDANTLDDYEEGTWTPTVTFGGNSAGQTYNVRVGNYTKIGRQVFIQGFVEFSNKGSSTGDALITGLPFTNSNSSAALNGGSVVGYTLMASISIPIIAIAQNQTSITLRNGTATTDPQMTHANFNPGLIGFVAQYFV